MRLIALRASTGILVCTLAVSFIRGQTAGHIRGTVVDDDGKALEGVSVEAHGSATGKRATTTAKDGQYRFPMIPPGTYKVRFSLKSYSEVEKNAVVRLDGTATINAKLFRLPNTGGKAGDSSSAD
jgi:hypothetical protein